MEISDIKRAQNIFSELFNFLPR